MKGSGLDSTPSGPRTKIAHRPRGCRFRASAPTDPAVAELALARNGSTSSPVGRPSRGERLRRRLAAASVRRWSLWSLRGPALAGVLVVDLVAVVLVAVALGRTLAGAVPVDGDDLHVALWLAVGCAVHIEAARGIERRREVVADGQPYIDLKSMWTFAGLLLLPLGPALVLVLFSYAYWWLRVSRRPVPHRWAFSAGTVVIASCGAATVLHLAPRTDLLATVTGPTGLLVVAAAGLVRWTINLGLVVGVIALSSPTTTWAQRLGSPADTAIGLGGLALGVAVAVLAATAPWIVPVLLVPVVGMHRGFLVGQFARAAQTDAKTGLATVTHWRDQAGRAVVRARRRGGRLAVLMVDLDEFKAVNDRHGHLAGDAVLRCAAQALRHEVRAEDAVGRFGGEEFVVCLTEVSPTELRAAAERVRRRIAACDLPVSGATSRPLTASIGVATYPVDADDLDGLLLAADTALLAAKRAGRDRVVFAPGLRAVSGTPTTP